MKKITLLSVGILLFASVLCASSGMPVTLFESMARLENHSDVIAAIRVSSDPQVISDGTTVSQYWNYKAEVLSVLKGNMKTGTTELALWDFSLMPGPRAGRCGSFAKDSMHIVFLTKDDYLASPGYRNLNTLGSNFPLPPTYTADRLAAIKTLPIQEALRQMLQDYLQYSREELKQIERTIEILIEGNPDHTKMRNRTAPNQVPEHIGTNAPNSQH